VSTLVPTLQNPAHKLGYLFLQPATATFFFF